MSAWAALYEQTYEPVFRHVCYLVGDAAAAEDLVQETFARAFTSIAGFDRRASFVSWVRGIALNLVRMHWRSAATKERAHASLASLTELTPQRTEVDPAAAHQQETRMRVLYEILAEMPEHLREVFILRELEGLSAREVGELLGITANNVGVRISRARGKIRDALQMRGWLSEGAAG